MARDVDKSKYMSFVNLQKTPFNVYPSAASKKISNSEKLIGNCILFQWEVYHHVFDACLTIYNFCIFIDLQKPRARYQFNVFFSYVAVRGPILVLNYSVWHQIYSISLIIFLIKQYFICCEIKFCSRNKISKSKIHDNFQELSLKRYLKLTKIKPRVIDIRILVHVTGCHCLYYTGNYNS